MRNQKLKIEATFLGTGTSQGVPVIACDCPVCRSTDEKDKRLRTSFLLKISDNNFVIDAGPDFRQQMLRERVQT
jgi:phosphoribosyl 1,2-cyclic phosphate phosphodiesterase